MKIIVTRPQDAFSYPESLYIGLKRIGPIAKYEYTYCTNCIGSNPIVYDSTSHNFRCMRCEVGPQ